MPQPAVETLDVGVLHRLARRDKVEPNAMPVRPRIEVTRRDSTHP